MRILVVNGPNINLLGERENSIYGSETYSDLVNNINKYCVKNNIYVDFYQSNHEGKIIDKLHKSRMTMDAIIINPAAYTHTSIAIRDAISAIKLPVIEVHISDVNNREAFRRVNYISDVCLHTITNAGINGYIQAVKYLEGYMNDNKSK